MPGMASRDRAQEESEVSSLHPGGARRPIITNRKPAVPSSTFDPVNRCDLGYTCRSYATGIPMKIAVLDDYLRLSQQSADWSKLPAGTEVTVFDRPLKVPDEAAEVLQAFD